MATILLIRHGESQSNAGKTTSDPECIELSPRGFQQADDVAREILESNISPDLFIFSPYLRAIQTAVPTRKLFPSVHTEDWPVQEFNYLSSWSKGNSTREDREPWKNAYWSISDPRLTDSRESESFEQFIKRAREVMIRLKKTKHHTLVMFSHEQFICALLWLSNRYFTPISSKTMKEYKNFLMSNPIPNGAIVRVQFRNRWGRLHYEVITSHLNKPELVASSSSVWN